MTDHAPHPVPEPVTTADAFLGLLRTSRLVAPARFGEVEAAVAAWREAHGPMPEACRQAILDGGLLTEWHIAKLLEGKNKGFFLDHFKLLKPLGQGGMGSVYLAEHAEIGKVAIKVLPRKQVEGKAASLARFQQENWAAARLNHPNIARAWDDFGEPTDDSPYHYFVMDYIEGVDLDKLVRKGGPLPVRDAADFIRQAALGLQYAHDEGFVHRDIKPANLIVDKKGRLKILDLGLVQMDADDETSKTLARDDRKKSLGTPDYMSPEQARGNPADHRSDIYSLGCTLYYLLSGHAPFDAVTGASGAQSTRIARLKAHIDKQPPDVLAMRPEVPVELVDVMRRMMEKEPADRVQSAREVAEWFAAWRAGASLPRLSGGARPAAVRGGSAGGGHGGGHGTGDSGSGSTPAGQRPRSGVHGHQADTPPPSSSGRSTGRMAAATSSSQRSSASGVGSTASRSGATPTSQPSRSAPHATGQKPAPPPAPAAAPTGWFLRRVGGLPLAAWLALAVAIALAAIWWRAG